MIQKEVVGMQELSDRKRLILSAIIDAYIESGEPVGSKYLTGNGHISFSSATIRNEMAELEELGYLEQPHTSAGRIPSEKGYRFYVDSLMKSYKLTSEELAQLNSLARSKAAELDGLLERAASVMTNLTNYTALTVRRKRPASIIKRYKAIGIGSEMLMLIMLTAAETVVTKYIHIDGGVDERGADVLEAALNELLSGVEPDEITLPLMVQFQMRMTGYENLIAPVMQCIYEAHSDANGGDIRFDGVNRLLQYPELRDAERLSDLLGAFDSKTDIFNVIAHPVGNGVNIFIGNENGIENMRHTSMIFRTIDVGGTTIGAIGVIGPCRMDYSKAVAAVDSVSRSIMKMLRNSDDDKQS